MAMDERLKDLYSKLVGSADAPSGDAIAALASGEQDEAALLAAASSRAGGDALALLLATGDDAENLARAAWRTRAGSRDASRTPRPSRIVPLPWLAAAAAIAFGFTVMLKVSAPPSPQNGPVAHAPDAADTLMDGGSFETATVSADDFESERPELFSDDFDA